MFYFITHKLINVKNNLNLTKLILLICMLYCIDTILLKRKICMEVIIFRVNLVYLKQESAKCGPRGIF